MVSVRDVGLHDDCAYSEPGSQVLVWEDEGREQAGLPPKFVGCTKCGEMTEIDW